MFGHSHAAAGLLVTALLSGCSGGHSSQPGPQPEPPPGGPAPFSGQFVGVYSGAPTPIGEFLLDERGCDGLTLFDGLCLDSLLDGAPATPGMPQPGSMIELLADPDDLEWPTHVDVQHAVIGPVEAVDPTRARLVVLGQSIHVTDLTARYGGSALNGVSDLGELAVGDPVAVSGHFSADGEIVASLIQRRDAAEVLLLRGVLAAGDNGMFRVGQLHVDLSAAVLEDFPGGAPLPGDTALMVAGDAPQGGILAVHSARRASHGSRQVRTRVLTGFVTAVRSNHDFDIGGFTFLADSCDTCDALDASGQSLRAGTHVLLVDPPGAAASLAFASTTLGDVGIRGPVQAIEPDSGSLVVLGVSAQTSPATHVGTAEGWGIGEEPLSLSSIEIGETVFVGGGLLDGNVAADSVIRSSDEQLLIEASSYALADTEIVILGQRVVTDGATTVQRCEFYYDDCIDADLAWLFSASPGPARLRVEVELAGELLRASRITAFTH